MAKKLLGSSKVGARYQITIPKEARAIFGHEIGDVVVFVKDGDSLILTKEIK